MSELNRYSLSAGGSLQNASGYFPEGQAPSTVNDAARTVMADIRRQHQAWSPEKTASYSGGTYSVTYDREVTSGEVNGIWTFIAGAANTSGSAKLAINGLAALDIVTPSGHLAASAIDAHQVITVAYNAGNSNFQLISPDRTSPVLSAENTTTGAKTVAFTGIPSWARKITILVSRLSLDGTMEGSIQLGTSSGYETTNYTGNMYSLPSLDNSSATSEFPLWLTGLATNTWNGIIHLALEDEANNTWVLHGSLQTGTTQQITATGTKSLAGPLDRLKIFSSDNFDTVQVAIRYER